MKIFVTLIIAITVALSLPAPTHAIIFLPALVLIPIAKIIIVLIGGFSIPFYGVAGLWSKVTNNSPKRAILLATVILLSLTFFIAILLKFLNPDRPWI